MYIYPITDPEILRLEIRMALYREPMPDYSGYDELSKLQSKVLKQWEQQSRIAYLKEPEFKVGDVVYVNGEGKEWELTEIHDKGYNLKIDTRRTNGKMSFRIAQLSDLSYYPGQEYDGEVKYVIEVEIKMMDYGSEHTERFEWQDVEEPPMNHMSPGQDDTDKFEEGVNKGEILAEIKI